MEKIVKLTIVVLLLAGVAGYFFFSGDASKKVIDAIPDKKASASGVTIVAFGDSLTAGYGLPVSESYPAQLELALRADGKNVSVINAGVSGETTRGNLERAPFIRSQNPDIVLLGIGGNDALRALPVAETLKNINETIDIFKAGENPPVVILLQMQSPLNAGLSYKRSFDALYQDIATTQGVILLPFLTTDIFLKQENKISDGIHLNKVGYGKIVEQYLKEPVGEVVTKMGG